MSFYFIDKIFALETFPSLFKSVAKNFLHLQASSIYAAESSCRYLHKKKHELLQAHCDEYYLTKPFSSSAGAGFYTKIRWENIDFSLVLVHLFSVLLWNLHPLMSEPKIQSTNIFSRKYFLGCIVNVCQVVK